MKELTIAGGGLAGLSLGIALRERGIPVTVVETGQYPRHRVCGEFITGVSRETLDFLGIADCMGRALPLSSTEWFSGSTPVLERTLPREAWGISRWLLDAQLAERFTGRGGLLKTRTRVDRKQAGAEGTVWATGRVPRGGSPKWLGLKVHLHGSLPQSDLELHLGEYGYAGISRIEDNRLNLCGLFRQDGAAEGKGLDLLESCLERSGLTRMLEHVRRGRADQDSFCAVAGLNYNCFRRGEAGFVLGDNWSLIPPFTGNGMSMAFETARLAVEPLQSWSAGELAWESALKLFRSRLRRRLAPRVTRARFLQACLMPVASRKMLAWLARNRVLPFHTLYALTH